MAGTQALEAQRAPAFSYAPEDLTLVTDPRDPLYDRRVEGCAVPRERVLDVAIRGVHTPIQVRRRGDDSVVIAGKQRTKAALVCNAIGAGVPYKGHVKAVKVAIEEFGADEDLVKKVTAFMRGKPIRVKAMAANSGDDSAARMLMRSENAQRQDDAKADRIRDVQEEIEKYATPIAELAIAHGVSEQTIARWSKVDLSAPAAAKGKRGKATRPSAKKVRAVYEALPEGDALRVPVGWMLGEVSKADFLKACPDLAKALG